MSAFIQDEDSLDMLESNGLNISEFDARQLEYIRKLQERGILVKLSYGGDEWGNLDVYEKTASWVRNNANVMVRTIKDLGTVFENYSKSLIFNA